MFTAAKWAGPRQGMLGSAAQPSTWKILKWLHNILTKKVLQHRERNWAVFGGARPNLNFECFWKASRHPEKKVDSTPWIELDRVWGSTTSRSFERCWKSAHHQKKKCLTPRNELGRDRGSWGARPSHQLDSFWNGCITSRRKSSSTPWKELGRVWGSTTQPKIGMFLKSFTPSQRQVDSTAWFELDRVWGSTTSR